MGSLPITPLSKWSEIRRYNLKGLPGFTLNDYWKIRGLEINTEFEQEILKTRIKIGISENGLSYEDYIKINPPYRNLDAFNPKIKKINDDFDKRVELEINRILKEFVCDSFVSNQLRSILLANLALPLYGNMSDSKEISIQSYFGENDIDLNKTDKQPSISIKISSYTKPEAVISFIRDNRERLSEIFSLLPKKNDLTLSGEKIMIVLARRENQKIKNKVFFTKLGMDKNIDKMPKTIEKEYNRAEEEIKSLFYKK